MSQKEARPLRRGHNEGNIRQRSDGRWEVRLSAGLDYKTGTAKRTSTCCNTRQEAIAILQEQAHLVRKDGWRDPMSVSVHDWYQHWLVTYMKNSLKRSTYISYEGFLKNHFHVIGNIKLKHLEGSILQELYNYKLREDGVSAKTIRNIHMALHKCLQQAMKEHLLTANPCESVTLPRAEDKEVAVLTTDQQRTVLQTSYRHRYGVFIRLTLCTGLRLGELLALKWEDIDTANGTLCVRRTLNRLSTCGEGAQKTEIVFDTPKTKNSRRTIPLPKGAVQDLLRWKSVQQADRQQAAESYRNDDFVVTNELGKFFEQKTFKTYYNRLLQDADVGRFTFHALRHTFATRALEKGMDYKTLSAILGHFSVAFTMDTYVHCMDERKRSEMDKMDDLYDSPFELPMGDLTYLALCSTGENGCQLYLPDFPHIEIVEQSMDKALLAAKQKIQKALRQYKNPPIPTKQEHILVPENAVLLLLKLAQQVPQ
ncbi:MAG: tyrosine-type recombinase/integrase [Ruthenibacterium sp.]